jgi:hypothetical protein
VVAKLIDGIALTEPREVDLFRQCTGRTKLPSGPVRRLIALAGRRGGKDRFLSAAAVWCAALCANWREYISAGEQAVVILLGADKKQAAILRRYCQGLLQVPLPAAEVVRSTDEVTEFRNGSSLEIATNDARLVRGRSAIAVLGSECCYWRTDEASASSDEEVVAAAEPSMAMTPDGGLLILGSSAYRRRGYMHRRWRELFGNDAAEDIVWLAPSRVMNPALPEAVVAKALADDNARASAEYLSLWRSDIESFVALEAVQACVTAGVYERAPRSGVNYVAFCDPSGGSADSFTLAVGRYDGVRATVVIDCVREVIPPFSPEAACEELAGVLASYGVTTVTSDKYAGAWVTEQFGKFDVTCEQNAEPKSVLYQSLLPLLNSGRIELLDHHKCVTQLCSLERKVGRSGRDSIDHAPGGHDDICNAVAGVAALAVLGASYNYAALCDDGEREPEPPPDYWQQQRAERYAALLERYGKPVSLMPREWREADKAAKLREASET